METEIIGNKPVVHQHHVGRWGLVLMLLTAILFIGHADSTAIVTWGLEFLRHVKTGTLYFYAIDLQEMGMPTNYGIFVNALTAVVISPLYILELGGTSLELIFYITWYKLILVVIFFLLIQSMKRIGVELHIDEQSQHDMLYIFCGSILVIFYSIAMGQVDLFSIYFMMLGIENGLQKKYLWMAFLLSIAVMIKAFPIFFCAPLFIYMFHKLYKQHKIIQFCFMSCNFIWPLLLERIICTICFKEYFAYHLIVNTYSFIPKIMRISVLGFPVVVLLMTISLLIFFFRVLRERDKGRDEVLFWTCIMFFLFDLLVDWTPQYVLYGMPFFLLATSYVYSRDLMKLIFGVVQMGLLCVCISRFNATWINAMLVQNSVVGRIFNPQEFYISAALPDGWGRIIDRVGQMMIYLCLACIIWSYAHKKSNLTMQRNVNVGKGGKLTELIYIVPTILYFMVILSNYWYAL